MNSNESLSFATSLHTYGKHLLKAAEGRAPIGSMIAWSMKNTEIWIAATLGNKDKVCPETAERMSLKYELTKGHLTTRQNKTKPPRVLRDTHHVAFLEHSVYFEESHSSSCDILLFLESKCIKREPAYIDVVNQYSWRG